MNRHVILLAALLSVSASATAQTRPADGAPNPGLTPMGGLTPPGGLTPAAGLSLSPIYELPGARAASAGAAVRLQNVKDDLEDFVRAQRAVFENSAEYTKAIADQDAAHKQFQTARQKVVDALMVSADYEATVQLRDETARKIEIEKAQKRPDPQRIEELAAYRTTLARKVGEMENGAFAQDGALTEARNNLMNAANKVTLMRRDFDLRLRTSQELAGAKRTVKDSREQFAVANVYAVETARVADVLLNYAYYTTYRITRKPPIVASPLLPYAYGYGYGSGYGGVTPGVTPLPGTVGGTGYGYVPYQ